jgi:hypothetical protein
MQSTKEMMLLAAKHYEERDKNEEAVLLYHKVSNLTILCTLCIVLII